jgi:RNA polymerase sigma-70 factor, ECF subfamily
MTEISSEQFIAEITRCQQRLRCLIRCLLVGNELVEDVLQETNMVLWKKAAEFEIGTDFWAWASRVARFQVMSQLKRIKRDRHVYDPELLDELATIATRKFTDLDAREDALETCLESLPVPQRQLLEMRYSLDQSVGEISHAIGRPQGSIRQTLYRLRTVLLNCVERRLAGPAAESSS